jgi:MerR family copper efflux transcriptional regulator
LEIYWSRKSESPEVNKLSDYLRISEAAEYLGVSPNTLRNWQNAGKIAAHRHPVNGYRLFIREELDALLEPLHAAAREPRRRTVTKKR